MIYDEIYLTANWLSPGGSGYYAYTQTLNKDIGNYMSNVPHWWAGITRSV